MKTRTFIIGDIHGADKALKQILERAGVSEDDELIFLGDYVDGWSGSAAVIDQLIERQKTNRCIFIRGNHDVWCEEWLATGIANEIWLRHGGKATVESYAAYDTDSKLKHLHFFKQMLSFHIDNGNNLFIHAGFSSMHGPQQEVYASNYSWDRTLWEMALTMDKRIKKDSKLYPKRLKLFHEIFIGHTPTLGYDIETPMNAVNVWNLDTGAGFYGKLTILELSTKKFWQSDPVKSLYPDEKGRN